jgi:hypothetical protein
MNSYDELIAEMEAIQQQMFEAKKTNVRTVLKEAKCLYNECLDA